MRPAAAAAIAAPNPPGFGRAGEVVAKLLDVGGRLIDAVDPRTAEGPVRQAARDYIRLARSLRLTLGLEARLKGITLGRLDLVVDDDEADEDLCERPEAPERESPESERLEEREILPDPRRNDRDRPDRETDEIGAFLRRPMTEMVAEIARGFGLSPRATRELKAPFAALEQRERGVASPGSAGVPPALPFQRPGKTAGQTPGVPGAAATPAAGKSRWLTGAASIALPTGPAKPKLGP